MDHDHITSIMNQGIECWLEVLNRHGVIDDAQFDELVQYQVVASTKKTFSQRIAHAMGFTKESSVDDGRIVVVKVFPENEITKKDSRMDNEDSDDFLRRKGIIP